MLKFFAVTLLLFTTIVATAQTSAKYTISGYTKDANTGETIIGTSIYVKELNKGSVSNEYGFYSISVPAGNYTLVVKYVGYQPINESITLTASIRKNYNLSSTEQTTKTVEIVGNAGNQNVSSTKVGTQVVAVEKIKTLPVILGEVDILKTIQLLPGIQSAGEGNSGFYVRGGGPDQNLLLLDEATVYNSGHLFGFFSIFNSDAINSVEVIKAGIPAEYGGRTSSVLNVKLKDGNNQHFGATGGIGLIASRLTLEGPVQKNKSSFIISARRTYLDVLIKPFAKNNRTLSRSGYYFYDLNTKINYQFSDKDRLYLSGYFGRDVFKFGGDRFGINLPWGNSTGTMRYNHLFNDKLFANTTLIFSDYTFELAASQNTGQNSFEFKLFSGIRDYTAKVDFDYFPNVRNQVKFGLNYTRHIFTPQSLSGRSDSVVLDPGRINRQYANDMAVYASNDFDITEKLRLSAGLRYSVFQQVGPYDRYVKGASGSIVDTIYYKAGQNIALHHGLEPRFTVRYSLSESSSFKASATRNYQYLHLASNSGSTLPADIWVPSSTLVKPQICYQYSLGYFRNFANNTWETSIEFYYKYLQNQIDYAEGQNTTGFNNNIENQFVFGKGKANGVEFFVKKAEGKFNGWIGYTFAYTTRQFPDLNEGKPFYAKFDRRHDLSVVLSYSLSKKWTLGAVFIYGSSSAYSIPANYVFISGTPGYYYEADYRNKYRLEPYHRADVSATYYAKKTDKRESSWNFSIYNVYNHQNQYIVYLDVQGDITRGDLKTQAKQITVFPLIPAITYNFKF